MNRIEALNELKVCVALSLKFYGDFNKTLCYFLVKAIDFFDPETDPLEIYQLCGTMLETIRLKIYTDCVFDQRLKQSELEAEWQDISLRRHSDDFTLDKYFSYKKVLLEKISYYDSYNGKRKDGFGESSKPK